MAFDQTEVTSGIIRNPSVRLRALDFESAMQGFILSPITETGLEREAECAPLRSRRQPQVLENAAEDAVELGEVALALDQRRAIRNPRSACRRRPAPSRPSA
jgi:hypothetical protein